MPRTRVVLVDDHRVVIDAIAKLLESEFDVVGIFEDGKALLQEVESIRPDVIILDIGMPNLNGLAIGSELKTLLPKTKLIFLTMHSKPQAASQAFKLGASGYVLKNAAGKELIKALREVVRGGYYASPELTEGMVGSFVQAFKRMEGQHELTVRQTTVLQLISEGYSMKQIAAELGISMSTVAFHKYTMMKQLDISTTAELISYGLCMGPRSDIS
jgi:DNA-binding NarL/FixJ family response regulator